ncbi:hypothetical protein, unlikely [Trypanosoma brucei gambiense DAL972]|uniref:Uncharacterized protein n=1 Tax=Trypanosoma brucei gambiense (strain MHOM/CI/86/DAL972) TaxID=679716 RepID=C9ZYA8_TRYB9|nr:hypothetical protein, unlikely [Trypanosoma brucei gambiense DAL972]CBH14407.1 hypothetical protein, unlikely [Trypanosoma brucei gambiense DAL972]|eukprot:XP_011776673.1 hypothetical protein, unlikely [Trypanosoma brucei gambiense DAL972]
MNSYPVILEFTHASPPFPHPFLPFTYSPYTIVLLIPLLRLSYSLCYEPRTALISYILLIHPICLFIYLSIFLFFLLSFPSYFPQTHSAHYNMLPCTDSFALVPEMFSHSLLVFVFAFFLFFYMKFLHCSPFPSPHTQTHTLSFTSFSSLFFFSL